MNTLECSFVVHHQLQSQYSMNIGQFQVSHYILRIYVYIRTHVSIYCKPMAVHMSGLYSSIAVVVVMQYAHYGVWCLPKLVQMLISVLGPSDMQYTCSCEF